MTTHPKPRPADSADPNDAIRRNLSAIREHADYLRHWTDGAEEHDAARAIGRLAREIETLLPAQKERAA